MSDVLKQDNTGGGSSQPAMSPQHPPMVLPQTPMGPAPPQMMHQQPMVGNQLIYQQQPPMFQQPMVGNQPMMYQQQPMMHQQQQPTLYQQQQHQQSMMQPGGGQQQIIMQQPYIAQPMIVMQAPMKPRIKPEWVRIMESDFCRCFDDMPICLMSTFCTSIQAGMTMSLLGESFLANCIFFECDYPCQRSRVQIALGMRSSGCLENSIIVGFCPICAISQSARAVIAWDKGGRLPPQRAVPQQPAMEYKLLSANRDGLFFGAQVAPGSARTI